MNGSEGSLQVLTGGLRLKTRVQHPKVIERTDRGGSYWYFRYWADEIQPDGSSKTVRKFQRLGASKGENRLTKKQAELERDKFLGRLNAATEKQVIAKGVILFREMAKMYEQSHLERENQISKPTREKARSHLRLHILPKWGDERLNEIEPKDVQDWLYQNFDSWWTMNGVRNLMSAIYHKAEEWGFWEEGRRSPISRVSIGKKWYKRPRRILTMEETMKVLARLKEPNLLITETAIATGARISEILGLQWKHVDLETGVITIEQRNWRGDIAEPKTGRSHRPLALGHLAERYRARAKADNADPEAWVFVRNDGSGDPLWDSGVRQAIKKAAAEEGCDFPGLGPHSFRRANITWRQRVGGTSIETSKIAGHSSIEMTEEYTFVEMERQDELTRAIQEKLASVGEKNGKALQPLATDPAAGANGAGSLAGVNGQSRLKPHTVLACGSSPSETQPRSGGPSDDRPGDGRPGCHHLE